MPHLARRLRAACPLLLGLAAPVHAEESPTPHDTTTPSPTDTAPDGGTAGFEARLRELEEQLAATRRALLLLEAEQAAAATPPAATPTSAPNAFNPRITAFGDVFASVGVTGGEVMEGSGPWLRSLELDIRADVDPRARAVAVLAIERESPLASDEDGGEAADGHGEEWSVAPEETYIDLVALPWGLSARAGAFRQPFGVSNRSHPHDLPWTGLPPALAAILGEEGFGDVGATLSWLAPVPHAGITLTGGALSGEPWSGGGLAPGWIGRGEVALDLGRTDVIAGASATGRADRRVAGTDLMVRWRASSWRSVLLLVEALTDGDQQGATASLTVQPTRPVYLGVRGDWLDGSWGGALTASLYSSEFLRLRTELAAWEDRWIAQAQLTFVWGSHPVEPYWVNR